MSFWYGTASKGKRWNHALCGADMKSDGLVENREKEALYLEVTIMGR